MTSARILWAVLHNCVAHPLEGMWTLLSLGRPTPAWIDRFHDWTAAKAWETT